jgi:integrase
MAKRLTALSIENMRPGPARREIPDGKGLYLVLQPSGARSWAVRYRFEGKPRKLTLGHLSLAAARSEAARALLEVEQGRDPGETKKAAEQKARDAAADTVRAVCNTYMRQEGKKLRSVAQRQRVLDRLIYPALGARPIGGIKRSEVVKLLDNIEADHGPAMAQTVLAALSKIFNWYASRADDFNSPIVRGMARVKPAEQARDRILDDEELRAVWMAAGEGLFGALVRFLLLTGARRAEATGLQWSELDSAGNWRLPASRNKVKVELIRPLSKAARVILAEQPRIGPFVFSSTGRSPLHSVSLSKKRFDAACGVTGWTLHDLRRTARSLMSRAGVNVDHAERALGHIIGGVRRTYDRHDFQPEMAHAFEALAAQIERIINPPAGNVTTLKRG